MAAYTNDIFANDSSTFNMIPDDPAYNLFFVLAVLNSTLLSHFQVTRSQLAQRDDFPKLSLEEARNFPFRRIAFTTTEKERGQLFEKSKNLYERCLAKKDFLCVTGFVDHCLTHKPERADVVHDLLGFLAKRMMEMNERKQAETKGFLEWLELTIGAKIDALKNKTKINAYHEGSVEELLETLKQNRNAIKINPTSKAFFDPLKDAYQKSMANLSPIKNNIATTDRLIDLVVYRLYGLSDDEIRVLEGESV